MLTIFRDANLCQICGLLYILLSFVDIKQQKRDNDPIKILFLFTT